MRSGCILVLLVAVAAAPLAAQAAGPGQDTDLGQATDPELAIGLELYGKGRYEAALGSFRAVIAARPVKFPAYVEAARCLIALGRPASAIDLMVTAESKPNPPAEVFGMLGQAYYWDGHAQLALSRASSPDPEARRRAYEAGQLAQAQFINAAISCRQAVRLRTNLPEAHYYLGRARLQAGAGGATEAVKALARAVALKPDQASYLDQLGEALYLEGKFPAAAEAFEKAAAAATAGFGAFTRDAWAKAGEARGRAGQTEAATTAFRHAALVGPDYSPTFQRIWNGFGQDAKTQAEGVKVLRALGKQHPDAALPPYYLGFFLRATGDHKGARSAWEACLRTKRGSTFAEAWAMVGEYVWFEDKDIAGAERHASRAIRIDPRCRKAYELIRVLTSQRFAAGKWVEAENLTRKLLDCRPDDGVEWSNLSLFLNKQKRYKEAWWAIEKALRHQPNNAQIHNTAGMLLHFHTFGGTDPMARAQRLYERSLELDPKFIHAMENLGMICAEQGDLERARELLQKAVDMDPGRGVAMRELSKVVQKIRDRDESEEEGE